MPRRKESVWSATVVLSSKLLSHAANPEQTRAHMSAEDSADFGDELVALARVIA